MQFYQLFKSGLSFEVGNENRIRFWENNWSGERPLKLVYPDVFTLAVEPTSVIASNFSILGGWTIWSLVLRRELFDWEIPRVTQLLDHLQGSHINMDQENRRVWRMGVGGQFTVSTCYGHVANVRSEPGP